MKATILCVSALLAALAAGSCQPAAPSARPVPPVPQAAPQPSPAPAPARRLAANKAWIIFGSDTIEAEVAKTDRERENGLMKRNAIPEDTGMLFVFTDEEVRTFWMSDTHFDLDVAFLDANLRLFDIQQLAAETSDPHDSKGPAMFAIEVRKGWFADHRVRVGARARLVLGPR